ncbi:MAG: MBL fold metallo-hydrolase [Proteobacteria bacterium]|nr:MBL fold metallo-hydrolase [Pseudomonadota bacterium]
MSDNFSVTLLGTGTPIVNPARACASTLVAAGDKTFIVDTGRGFYENLVAAGHQDVDAALFTHFHSDHIADFGELLVSRTIAGATQPLTTIGPNGVTKVVDGFTAAYELDRHYRHSHHGDNYRSAGASARVIEAEPGVVYDQDGVTVTMFDVDHMPVSPAVGYRFEYQGRVIVISGDTNMVPAMIEQSRGADILVHDTMNKDMVRSNLETIKGLNSRMEAMGEDILEYHADRMEVAKIAQEAGVKKLVLTHLVPGIPLDDAAEAAFTQGMEEIYTGTIITGRDGMNIAAGNQGRS